MTKQRKQAIIATACGIIAALCVFAYTATIQSEASMARASAIRAYGGDRVEVLVASKTIPIGGTIDESNTTTQEWLVDLLPQGQAARSYDELGGMVAQSEIRVNEPVLLERVGDGSSRITVPDGLAAASVASDDVLAVGGAIRAGSVVDVYVESIVRRNHDARRAHTRARDEHSRRCQGQADILGHARGQTLERERPHRCLGKGNHPLRPARQQRGKSGRLE